MTKSWIGKVEFVVIIMLIIDDYTREFRSLRTGIDLLIPNCEEIPESLEFRLGPGHWANE